MPAAEDKDPSESGGSAATSSSGKNAKVAPSQASTGETLSFVFGAGGSTVALFFVGLIGAVGNGAVYPILAYVFSNSFSDISSAATEGLDQVRDLAFTFMVVGAFALVMATIQTTCFEMVAHKAALNLRLTWFRALLRQDPAFFDVHDIGGIAATVGPSANRYRRGLGRKFGEGIQFFITGVGGIGYAMYASYKVALVVLGVMPFISIAAITVVSLNQSKSQRASKSYSR
jgi:ATP-binding cassette subfamily B (MDR/TAP) protein 1